MEPVRDGLLLPERSEPQADADVFVAYREAHLDSTETYEALKLPSDRKDAVIKQLSNGIDADMTVSMDNTVDVTARIDALKTWKQKLIEDESVDPLIKRLYRWRVNEDIANLHMLEASANGDMRAFRRWNEFIYGKPDEAIYLAALDWVANDADTILGDESQPEAAKKAAERVKGLLQDKRGYRELLYPGEEVFESVRTQHYGELGYLGTMMSGVELPEGKVNNEVGDPVLLHWIQEKLGSDYTVKDADGATWSVSHSEGVLKRPATYNMPVDRFIGLPLHEMRHLIEKVNGDRGPLALAAAGLDRVESGNEGRAVITEQMPYETFDEFGKLVRWRDILRRHIAISFASGVGAHRPATSSETYALMNVIDTMYQTRLTPDDPEATTAKAAAKTGELCARVLKGTDGTGGAYLKDMVYLEGHVANWLTAAQRGADAVAEGDLGKFDINNARHIEALQELGLLPAPE